MRFKGLKWLLLFCISITAGWGADSDKSRFVVRPVTDYPHRQTSEKVSIAAQPYETDAQAAEAFGKVNPYRLGVLPLLIVIRNEGAEAIRLDNLRIYYVLPDRTRVEATPAQELKFRRGPVKPSATPGPAGRIAIKRGKKDPLAEWEIEGRAFAPKILAAGDSASGFFYFQVPQSSAAASVYISGLVNAKTGNELYYFEIPMSGN